MNKHILFALALSLVAATGAYALSPPVFIFNDESDFAPWYSNAVYHLEGEGVITGYNDGSFKPNQNVTRGEMALMLQRFEENILDEKLESLPQKSSSDDFVWSIDNIIDNMRRYESQDIEYKTSIIIAESGVRLMDSAPEDHKIEVEDEDANVPEGYEVYLYDSSNGYEAPAVYLHYTGYRSFGDYLDEVDEWFGPF